MSILTPFFHLYKKIKGEPFSIEQFNGNMDIIDTEMHRPPLTVNGIEPDSTTRDLELQVVPLADNLTSEEAQINTGIFVIRTSGGEASISNGSAWLSNIKGNMVKTGYVSESLNMTVTPIDPDSPSAISASIDRDDFVDAVSNSGTYTFTYTTAWSADPAEYGITVTGTPEAGDQIVVVYVKENRGTITTANPTSFVSTGWNLYNHSAGYARVVKYSDDYGFMIDGTYTALSFSETVSGERISITPVNGYFTVPSDGYVFVTGGDSTSTEIWMTWSDWTEEANSGTFEAYTQTQIDLTGIMVNFPYGLMKIDNVYDEIDLNTQRAYSRIERLAYTEENLATVIASGVAYDTDTGYIYAVRVAPVAYVVNIDGEYTVSDHGEEMFIGTTIPLTVSALYGNDLKNKLRRDVLTISEQSLTSAQKRQVMQNLGIADDIVNGLSFGINSQSLQTVLTNNWQSKVPPDGRPVLCHITSSDGNYFGYLTLYSVKYGSGILTKYDGKTIAVFLNNGTVSSKNITPESVSQGNLTKVDSHITNVERARFDRAGRVVIVGVTFTVTGTIDNTTAVLFSGAPKAVTPVRAVIAQSNGSKIIRLEANQLGNITNAYSQGNITDGVFEGEIVYVCTDEYD